MMLLLELLPDDLIRLILSWLKVIDLFQFDTALTSYRYRLRWKNLLGKTIAPNYECEKYFLINQITAITVLPKSRIIVSSKLKGDICVLTLVDIEECSFVRFEYIVPGWITTIDYTPDTNMLLCTTFNSVTFVFNLDSLSLHRSFSHRDTRFITPLSDGMLLMGEFSTKDYSEFRVDLWNYIDGTKIENIIQRSSVALLLSDGRFISYIENLITVWDISDVHAITCLKEIPIENHINAIYELPNGDILLQYQCLFFTLNLETGECGGNCWAHTYSKLTIFNSSKVLVTNTIEQQLYLHDLATDRSILIGGMNRFSPLDWGCGAQVVLSDERLLIHGRESKLVFGVWNIARNECERFFVYPEDAPFYAPAVKKMVLPDYRFIVQTKDGLMIWSPIRADEIRFTPPGQRTMIIQIE